MYNTQRQVSIICICKVPGSVLCHHIIYTTYVYVYVIYPKLYDTMPILLLGPFLEPYELFILYYLFIYGHYDIVGFLLLLEVLALCILLVHITCWTVYRL